MDFYLGDETSQILNLTVLSLEKPTEIPADLGDINLDAFPSPSSPHSLDLLTKQNKMSIECTDVTDHLSAESTEVHLINATPEPYAMGTDMAFNPVSSFLVVQGMHYPDSTTSSDHNLGSSGVTVSVPGKTERRGTTVKIIGRNTIVIKKETHRQNFFCLNFTADIVAAKAFLVYSTNEHKLQPVKACVKCKEDYNTPSDEFLSCKNLDIGTAGKDPRWKKLLNEPVSVRIYVRCNNFDHLKYGKDINLCVQTKTAGGFIREDKFDVKVKANITDVRLRTISTSSSEFPAVKSEKRSPSPSFSEGHPVKREKRSPSPIYKKEKNQNLSFNGNEDVIQRLIDIMNRDSTLRTILSNQNPAVKTTLSQDMPIPSQDMAIFANRL